MTQQPPLQLAIQHHNAGRLTEAESVYRQVLAQDPGCLEALNNLGNLLRVSGKLDESIATFEKALTISPQFFAARYNLGLALRAKGDLLGAIATLYQALRLKPDFAEGHNDLGSALLEAGRPDDAIVFFRRAISLQPGLAEVHFNLGTALLEVDQVQQSIDSLRTALQLKPAFPAALNQLGTALKTNGHLPQAIAAYRQAIAFGGQDARAHFNLGTALLQSGEFASGWREIEWRFKTEELAKDDPNLGRPRWDGSELNGRRILLHSEQGYGDTIQFARFIPLVAQRGGRIILACPTELRRLLGCLECVEQFITETDPLPDFDLRSSLMSLPGIFGTTLETIPASVPYLKVEDELISQWGERLTAHTDQFKVGLAWAGSPTHKNDRNRSIPVSELAPLADLKEIAFVSLQKSSTDPTFILRPSPLTDFADTAALIANLDLVISVDTAVAHLAGAMNKPVWVLLPFAPDWRWMMNRCDSLWYPSMRLFRQPAPGDWQTPTGQIVQELSCRR